MLGHAKTADSSNIFAEVFLEKALQEENARLQALFA